MFKINPAPEPLTAEQIAGLKETDTGTIGHFVDAGFMDSGITAAMPGTKIVGTAVTVRVTVPDSVIAHYALKDIRPGDIIVIDRGQDRRTACWGGTTSAAAAAAGLAGLIMDGAGNDLSQATALGLPIWCRGVTPVTTKYRGLGGELNTVISCGGVAICPGDAVLADENGVVVIPRADVDRVIAMARQFQAGERGFLERLSREPDLCYPDVTGATRIVEDALAKQAADAR